MQPNLIVSIARECGRRVRGQLSVTAALIVNSLLQPLKACQSTHSNIQFGPPTAGDNIFLQSYVASSDREVIMNSTTQRVLDFSEELTHVKEVSIDSHLDNEFEDMLRRLDDLHVSRTTARHYAYDELYVVTTATMTVSIPYLIHPIISIIFDLAH